jgi:hypothetical protein
MYMVNQCRLAGRFEEDFFFTFSSISRPEYM